MADDWYFDAHSDLPSRVLEERAAGREGVVVADHLPAMREGRIGVRVAATFVDDAYLPEQGLRRALKSVTAMRREIAGTDDLALATAAADLREASGDACTFVLSLEGAEPLMGDLDVLDAFHALGVRLLTLTHSRRNAVAEGAPYAPRRSGTPGGVSAFGATVLERLEELGVVPDVSHLDEPGVWDALELTDGPLVASHSNCRALCDRSRNLPDEAIAAVADTGGVVGIMAVSDFLTPPDERATVEDVLDHVEHAVEVAGPEHVGFGFDFFEYLAPYRDGWADDVPFGGHAEGLDGDADVTTLAAGLRDRGFDDGTVRAICRDNFVRVFERVLP